MDEIDEQTQLEERLYEQLLASPVVELTGIVNASGVGAGKSGGQELWSLLLCFDAWRVAGGAVRTESLTIRRRVNDKELDVFMSRIEADTVIRIRGRVAEENVFGVVQAHLDEYLGLADDDFELSQRLGKLQESVTFDDDQFGTFTFDRRIDWFSAAVEWAGNSINLRLHAQQPEEVEACLKVARELWAQQPSWKNRIEDYAVEDLLPLKNENWLDEDESEISPEQFKSRMTLQSIGIYPDGDFDFWHDDGDLFWGHAIQISGSLAEGPTRADIPG